MYATCLLENRENASTGTSIVKNSNVMDCTTPECIMNKRPKESNLTEETERQKCYNTLEDSTEDIFNLPTAILQFESKNGSKFSQDNIKKAKTFVIAHLAPQSDYVTVTDKFKNLAEFEMIENVADEIQRSTLSLVTLDKDNLEVTLQGSKNNVASAKSRIFLLLNILNEQLTDDGDSNNEIIDSYGKNYLVESQPKENVHIIQNTFSKKVPIPESIQSIPYSPENMNVVAEVEDDCFKSQNLFSTKEIQNTNFMIPCEIDTLSEEKIATDSRYSKQFEQAIKLGYSEEDVSKVLLKLGPNSELNDILSELLKTPANNVGDLDKGNAFSKDEGHLQIHEERSCDFTQPFSKVNNKSKHGLDTTLRHIIIDGSNVAMSHGKTVFSCRGIKIAVDWFRERGHTDITAFVPQWRKETSRPDALISGQDILAELEQENIVVFTPARRVKGRRVVCYDDRYILKLAVETDGIVVSNDVYRDLVNENEEFRKVVDQRLLMYSFVNDRFMPPEDPLGRLGPSLENFLRKTPLEAAPKPQDCPYGKKCTYGNKCRFYHPERGFALQKSITDTLKEQADIKLQQRASKLFEIAEKSRHSKQKLSRTKSLYLGDDSSIDSESLNRKEKPKFSHSKSLASSFDLTEARKKLEKAELSDKMEKMSVKEFNKIASVANMPCSEDLAALASKEEKGFEHVFLQFSNPQLPAASHIGTGDMRSARTSPSHLTVPKSEQRYVSGHLLLAKKLSDEGNEAKFFYEHSSPSSTRTTSPVRLKPSDTKATSSSCSQPHPNIFESSHCLAQENIPNLSIFEPTLQVNQMCVNRNNSLLPFKHMGLISNQTWGEAISPPQSIFPRSPDSGHYTDSEPLSSPFHGILEHPSQIVSRPCSSEGHSSLRRAYSSIGYVKDANEKQQIAGRKLSAAVSCSGEHSLLKPQQSMPTYLNQSAFFLSSPKGLVRQNSSSDPQIHTSDTVVATEFDRKICAHQFSNQHHQGELSLGGHQQLDKQQQYQRLSYQNKQEALVGSVYAATSHFSSQQTCIPYIQSPVHFPPYTQHNMTHGSNSISQYHRYQAHTMYNPNYPGQLVSQDQGLYFSTSTNTPLPKNMPQGPNGYNSFEQTNTPSQQAPYFTASLIPCEQNTLNISPEDAPILPDDCRYSIYYHLSNVFGEAVVRKIMNRNPGVIKAEELCSLILEFKQNSII
ncbi:uncharacterized protein LOC131948022 isoform X2 [Physella acuta]|uniref:uncharacterized protein LOC131948022 isoform X2 n=1 Tax=Physella acuta TaxID=109671 RepID=UPI0027DD113F|nr:uncharacterized protein LOC131948022 isoform X2 [Physella acuta]